MVGNAVKNKIQQQKNQQQNYATSNLDVPEEDQLNELLQSQIASDDETEVLDISAVDAMSASLLNEDPNTTTATTTSSSPRYDDTIPWLFPFI